VDIAQIRAQIDEIDRRICDLLGQRAALAQEIGKLKATSNQAVFAPGREQEVIANVRRRGAPPLPAQALVHIFTEIISASRALESPVRVAYLGPAHTFAHVAALQRFGSSCEMIPATTVEDVFREVERRNADFGVVPIENSTEGVERRTLDAFVASDLRICAEIYLRIAHCLVSAGSLQQIRVVRSHPQALAQCRQWLAQNLPHAELIAESSTARAAEVVLSRPAEAAIATRLAGESLGLGILVEHIEDQPQNYTRFFVLGAAETPPTGRDKTSIAFQTQHKPGALCDVLAYFKEHGVNLTMIESRPMRDRPWHYLFFVDLQGHAQEPAVSAALAELQGDCAFLKVLGSYPEASPA
jgi:chorismate mutase/prephenate dehydratase